MRLELGNPDHVLRDRSPTWDAAISPALIMWNQQLQRAQLTGVVRSPALPSSSDHANSVVFSSTIFGQSFGSNTLAVTYVTTNENQFITQADVLFNSAQHFDSYRGPLRFDSHNNLITDIRRVFLHELGHVLGLDHPDDFGQNVAAIMNSIISDRDTLAPDDIRGIRSLYGVPLSAQILRQYNDGVLNLLQTWEMDGPVITGFPWLGPGSLPLPWNIAASGDFNRDGQMDIVLQNIVTGQRTIWLMNGTTVVGNAALPHVALEWEIVSASDFNGDGKVDLLLQNNVTGERLIWIMNGTTRVDNVSLGIIARDWKIKGSSDFNGDGKADILWQNDATGERLIWLMNRTSHIGNVSLGTIANAWDIAGTGDFNYDGKRDILLQNSVTGDRLIWFMNGTHHTGNAHLDWLPIEWNIRNQ